MIEDGLVNDDIRQAYFTPVASKQALVCSLSSLIRCIALLPSSLQQQTAFSVANIRRAVGRKSAMVLVAKHRTTAGVIIINSAKDMLEQSGSIGLTTYQLPLAKQAQLTLWHEIGHLYNIALQGSILPSSLTEYQHEWLADLYLLWRISQHYQQLDLAWQQLHRRNLALINDSGNLSHWSAPQLQIVLSRYDAQQLQQFTRYEDFLTAVYPLMPTWSTRDMGEFSSLVQRTFSAVQSLPEYIFWRQPELIQVLSPTLERLMGKAESQRWLKSQFSTVK
ncbi:hypothetical protein EGC82_04970 [Shewanella livingstonensis]|uniref:Uncharacterized protein n=2 Tax=Shewanella livingstonensis TaxID=150120 RepID=A0A3G8LZJ8_9GAMM|nr:hypothetical protein EGC82_04970 [Shewanella livingstonensis]